MFVTRCAVILLGIVLVVQQASGLCGCSYGGCGGCGGYGGGGGYGCGGSWSGWKSSSGFGFGSGESMCTGRRGGTAGGSEEVGENCNPLVVRPQAIPRPALPVPVALAPVAGPCACKKAIVKPAVLPKPVSYGTSSGGSSCTCSCNHNINSYSSSVLDGRSTAVLDGSNYGCSEYPPIVLDENSRYNSNSGNLADLAPADAVSIAIAQQNAQKKCYFATNEDRLAFGFRKIPQEVPKLTVKKEIIPEERIFDMNGQVVELKEVKVCAAPPVKSVDEEAAEDLLALHEEQTYDNAVNEGYSQGFRRISLGEIGYGPAKPKCNTFVDVPASAISDVAGGAANALDAIGGAIGNAIGAAGGALGLGDATGGGCNSGFVAGKVVYKTVPKQNQVCIPIAQDTADCESEEEPEPLATQFLADAGETKTNTGTCFMPCGCCCAQNVYHQSQSATSSSSSSSTCNQKAKLLIERYNSDI